MFESSSLAMIPGSTRIISLLQLISRISCAIVSIVGCLGLIGWVFDIAFFKQIVPGLATMKANTALSFVLAGAALACLHAGPSRRLTRWAGRICASAVVLIAVLTLSEYFVGWDVGLDQLLFADPASTIFPGRMSIITALSFSLLGLALLLLDVQRAYWLVSMLIFVALLIAWIAMIGYIYGVTSLYAIFPFATIAVHTAGALIVLGIGALFARPSYGLAALLARDAAAGLMARRLLPVAVFMPVLLGWLRWKGQLVGLYNTEFGLMIMVVAATVVFTAFIWWNAKSLNRLELDRMHIAKALHISEERFRAIFEQAAVGIARVGPQGQWLQVNEKLCDIVGYTRAELLDRTFQAITYPADLDADLAYVGQMLAGEIPTYSMEKRYIRKDGSLIWINLTVSLVREPSGEPKYFIAVIQDIADRKGAEDALRESKEQLGGIVGSAMDAIVSVDEARGIVLFNAAAEQMFRCPAASVLGQSFARTARGACAILWRHRRH
jgi:PAS domain S-box-containing protein